MRLMKYSIFFASMMLMAATTHSSRIKDLTNIAGVRDNQLIGYGLVVGLNGTGDRVNQTTFTQQTFKNMLLQFGIRLPVGVNLQLQNVAAVSIDATLPPFAKLGQRIDVTVSSLGNATSLRGGELLLTPLRGADGQVYAMAQGSVVVSGFGAQGGDGSKVIVNVTSSGRIANGATVEKTIDMPFVQNGAITFELNDPDFTTAQRIAQAINKEFGRKVAHAIDASDVAVHVNRLRVDPADIPEYHGEPAMYYKGDSNSGNSNPSGASISQYMMSQYVPIISRIENIVVQPAEVRGRVVINSRTGTIVVGQDVFIAPVAVSHGNLSVVVSERQYVSQPQGFSQGNTVVGTASDINVNEADNRAFVFAPGASLNDLVDAVNAVGAAPGDLIAILEAIKSAGALHADLDVI